MAEIEIKGDIVNDDWGNWYEWLGYTYTSPSKVINQIKAANGEKLTIKINSPGGDIFAASDIYTELRAYEGEIEIKITGMAASAASVIAMAGKSSMSPTAQLMVHNVSTGTWGDYRDMEHTAEVLRNANDTIANAYMCKTGMTREEALELMNNETYLSATKAQELGFVDEIMFEEDNKVNLSALQNLNINSFVNAASQSPFDIIKNLKDKIKTEGQHIQTGEDPKKNDDFSFGNKTEGNTTEKNVNSKKIQINKTVNEVGGKNMFKDREDYLNQKKALIDKMSNFCAEGNTEEYEKTKTEIENLDKDFETFSNMQAEIKALNDSVKGVNLTNIQTNTTIKNPTVASTLDLENNTVVEDKAKEPKEYLNAWAKNMLGQNMTNEERKAFDFVNSATYTHTTENTGVLVPEEVMSGIFKEVEEQYPLWKDVLKTNAPGSISLLKSESSSDAKWYDEETETEDGKETFKKVTLNGCELSRSITVSWKLKAMAIKEFIPFIQSQLSEKIGAALGYGVSQGRGVPGESDNWEAEPMGVVTALNKTENVAQVIEYTDIPTYQEITTAVGKVKGAYKNEACFYANGTTIWQVLANIVDKTGRPYFVANPISGGVGTILGKTVKEDDSMKGGEILFGNAKRGYHANINKQVLLDSEDHKKKRETDYIAYGIVDGNIRTADAFSLLKKNS